MKLVLSDAEFDRLRALLGKAAGLVFDDSRRDALAFCVGERIRTVGVETAAAYLDLISAPTGEAERQALLDDVTIPETHFFRNPPQITALRRHVLPQLLKDAAERGDRRLRIWSAGCSTGEEAYTVAMLIRELLPLTHGWDIRIIATDISRRGLQTGTRGRYPERSLVMTEPDDANRWFIRDVDEGMYEVRPEVRELVEFRRHNLVTEGPPFEPGEVDLVLCRNVTIYFDRSTTRALVGRLHSVLRDGGYLFLGHAETLWQVSDAFRLVSLGDAFIYRRDDTPPPPPEATDEELARHASERRSVLPDRRGGGKNERFGLDRRSGHDRRLGNPPGKSRNRPTLRNTIIPKASEPPAPVTVRQPEPSPLAAVRQALGDGRYDEAVQLAESLASAEPLAVDAHYLRGLALCNLGRDAEALVDLRKAVYLDPELGFAHFLLAGALARVGEGIAAGRSYRAAATALERMPADLVAAELGGRSAAELAELCRTLAERAESASGDDEWRGASA
jgi:chemotaxis protein methyltransferase CheR